MNKEPLKDNEKNSIKALIPKRDVNEALWSQTTDKANGSEIEKNEAVAILFERHYSLPPESTKLLKQLSGPQQARSVRMNIANRLSQEESQKTSLSPV